MTPITYYLFKIPVSIDESSTFLFIIAWKIFWIAALYLVS